MGATSLIPVSYTHLDVYKRQHKDYKTVKIHNAMDILNLTFSTCLFLHLNTLNILGRYYIIDSFSTQVNLFSINIDSLY